ncbi:MAG: mannosyltransferase [Candidatus Rokubacteria bacterium RIFCSPLOWO2_12_FULL_71_19]|nr:MAG: mannosyltransferase [Candidatus Rokubacteria bacterium RIFCSPLOWO2_12_FULL_71_19]
MEPRSAREPAERDALVAKIVGRNLRKTYPGRQGPVHAIVDFSLDVAEGEFLCLVGPSGCGKSTFLRLVAGLLTPSSGEVEILRRSADHGQPLTSIVFQEYAIFPWKTVRDNVGFGLQMRRLPPRERREVVDHWLGKVGLRKFAEAFPRQLSGGMKQRVAIARAFANDPEVLLMDEPLGALDAQTRVVLQQELLRLWEEDKKTVLYVTHSLEEAVLLGDRVVLMTAHPGTPKAEYRIDFPRPRGLELTAAPEFSRTTYTIWSALQDEVLRAMEAEA